MKRGDLITIGVILIIALIGILLITSGGEGAVAHVLVKGESTTVNLSEEKTFSIHTESGYNEVQIKDGAICIIDADCPDGACIHQGAKSRAGETIVCLPHEVIIRIDGAGEVDAVVE